MSCLERIKLTRKEKKVLRLAADKQQGTPDEFLQREYTYIVRSLKRKGLVDAVFVIGDKVSIVWLSEYGKDYLSDNPKLRNPFPWELLKAALWTIATIGSVISAVLMIIACSSLLK